jgi:triacylglycerol lipase
MNRTAPSTQSICTILVPGWLDNDRTLARLRTYLELRGVRALICSPQPSDGSAPIERLAEQLAAFIETGFEAEERVNLFGFSMGGLIHRVFLQEMGGWRRVHKFVTVATPHRGTMTARLASRMVEHEAWVQMRPDSNFILKLNGDLSALERVQFTSVWSPLDLTIVPANSSVLPVGKSRRIWSPAHGIMMYDPNVMRVIAEILRA